MTVSGDAAGAEFDLDDDDFVDSDDAGNDDDSDNEDDSDSEDSTSDEQSRRDGERTDDESAISVEDLRDHVIRRTIVLPEHRVLFMPTPKAACTTILWQLATLGGQQLNKFDRSWIGEVSTALTIHDMRRWESRFRFSSMSEDEQAAVWADDSWFRFTTVRNPATRVWSAWQSKLLLREPRFLRYFGDQPWFPRIPDTPAHVIEDFRAFVVALADPTIEDVHWTLQSDLLRDLPFNHVGRSESLGEVMQALAEHLDALGSGARLEPGRDNRTPLRMPRNAYDEASAAVLNARYAEDFSRFGYEPVVPTAERDLAWSRATAPILPLLSDVIDHNARIGQLSTVARQWDGIRRRMTARAAKAEQRVEAMTSRRGGPGGPTSPVLNNAEDRTDFAVRWAWDEDEPLKPGFTAIVRVKNEARPLPFVLPPLLRALQRVVIVDNASTDGTPELAREIAEREGFADRLKIANYPFEVARCGADHLSTPGDSVHSLTFFYNWSFSKVRTSYALKWDGDMVLTETGVKALQDLDWQLEATLRIVTMPRYPLYVADDSTAFIDIGLLNRESWGWPNRPGFVHVKAIDWELPMWPDETQRVSLPDWSCVELKWLDADEFAHWSSDTDFSASARTGRKEREWQVWKTLASDAPPPRGVIPVSAPAGMHVVDYVREQWLIENRQLLSEMAEQAALRKARRQRRAARRRRQAARAARLEQAASG